MPLDRSLSRMLSARVSWNSWLIQQSGKDLAVPTVAERGAGVVGGVQHELVLDVAAEARPSIRRHFIDYHRRLQACILARGILIYIGQLVKITW